MPDRAPQEQAQTWVGREESRVDHLDPVRMAALAAVLDSPHDASEQAALPSAWHWACSPPLHRQSESGIDGHAARGGFLPPIELPRRMWAGSRIVFHAAPESGLPLLRRSVIEAIEAKQGRTGELVFVKVRHELSHTGRPLLTEWQDIVYRDGSGAAPPAAGTADKATGQPQQASDWHCTVRPGEVLLFRYSAITFNAHRIHYDRAYATGVEGYPDLVVHGPLQATLLLDLVARHAPDRPVAEFRFRGLSPAFCGRALTLAGTVEGDSVRLRASDDHGRTTMEASAVLRR